jgi:1-acyl-sn-glycerol-3-phosphate acyltransferase
MSLSWLYYLGCWLARLLLLVFTRWEVKGKENVPTSGALIVVANHLHNADPPILGASIPRKLLFMAKEELFQSWPGGFFISAVGAFPVRRGGQDRRALKTAQAMLRQGMVVAMFPEGTRSKTAQLQTAFPGSALVALQCGAPVLPVGITGSDKLRGGALLFRRPRVLVNIGHPFTLPHGDRVLSRSVLQEATTVMMNSIAGLLPPSYRGAYGEEPDAAH